MNKNILIISIRFWHQMLGMPITGRSKMCWSIWQHFHSLFWLCHFSWSYSSARCQSYHVQENQTKSQWRMEIYSLLCQTWRTRHWRRWTILLAKGWYIQHSRGELHLQQQRWVQYWKLSSILESHGFNWIFLTARSILLSKNLTMILPFVMPRVYLFLLETWISG